MEYYDSKEKKDLYDFYFLKLNKMLRQSEVVDILDKQELKVEKYEAELNLFKENIYKVIEESVEKVKPRHMKKRSKSLSKQELQKLLEEQNKSNTLRSFRNLATKKTRKVNLF
jgi:hypothetical protein